jgi:hypothetical protein
MRINLSHVISIVTIGIMDVTYNAFFYFYMSKAAALSTNGIGTLWNAFVNIAFAAGAAYYAYQAVISASGASITTTPESQAKTSTA